MSLIIQSSGICTTSLLKQSHAHWRWRAANAYAEMASLVPRSFGSFVFGICENKRSFVVEIQRKYENENSMIFNAPEHKAQRNAAGASDDWKGNWKNQIPFSRSLLYVANNGPSDTKQPQ